METRMVIIGAGIAGLSTGCYALMNGYKTNIFGKVCNESELPANKGGDTHDKE